MLSVAYQLVFRRSLRGEKGWRTRAGRHEAICERLTRAEAGDYTGLWDEMATAHEARVEREVDVDSRRVSRLLLSLRPHDIVKPVDKYS